MYQITKEHYDQLRENYKNTLHLMPQKDADEMRNKLNEMRKILAFESCVKDWKEGKPVYCTDFIRMCEHVGIEITDFDNKFIQNDLLEVSLTGYFCIGKIGERKEKRLKQLVQEFSEKENKHDF